LKRDVFEHEMAGCNEELTSEIETSRAAWEAETAQRDAETKERDAAEARRRKREEEEYRYSFAREQQADKAYGQVQDIAVKALEGSSAFKSFVSAAPLAPSEPQRRPYSEK
jgi:hypothetical protein